MPKYNITVEKIQEDKIPEWVEWKYTKFVNQADRVIDAVYLSWKPKAHIKKVSKNEFVELKTGEVREFMPKNEETGKNIRNRRSLTKIFKDLQQLINTNFDGGTNQQFLTLTYKENMTDDKQLYKDFEKFCKKLNYHYPDADLQYIAITEPQGRGAWHVHMLVKAFNSLAWFPSYKDDLQPLWKHGNLKGELLEKVSADGFGSYFYAYFSNVEITDDNRDIFELSDSDIKEKDGKKYIKGERLDMYPDYMKIYRTSKGIVKPTTSQHENTDGYYQNYIGVTKMESEESELYVKKEQYKRKK